MENSRAGEKTSAQKRYLCTNLMNSTFSHVQNTVATAPVNGQTHDRANDKIVVQRKHKRKLVAFMKARKVFPRLEITTIFISFRCTFAWCASGHFLTHSLVSQFLFQCFFVSVHFTRFVHTVCHFRMPCTFVIKWERKKHGGKLKKRNVRLTAIVPCTSSYFFCLSIFVCLILIIWKIFHLNVFYYSLFLPRHRKKPETR